MTEPPSIPPPPAPGTPPTVPSFPRSNGPSVFLFPLGTNYQIALSPNFFPQALENIAKTWDGIQLDIAPYKDKGHHRLR